MVISTSATSDEVGDEVVDNMVMEVQFHPAETRKIELLTVSTFRSSVERTSAYSGEFPGRLEFVFYLEGFRLMQRMISFDAGIVPRRVLLSSSHPCCPSRGFA